MMSSRRSTRWTSRCFRAPRRRQHRVGVGCDPPAGLLPLRSLTDYRLPRAVRGFTVACRAAASHEVCGSSSTTHQPSPLIPGLPHPVRSALRVSHPLDGLLLDWLPAMFQAGALMEFLTLQSFSLVRSRHASRRAHALLSLAPTRRPWRSATAAPRQPRPGPRGVSAASRRPRTTRSRSQRAGRSVGLDFRALLPGSSPLSRRRR